MRSRHQSHTFLGLLCERKITALKGWCEISPTEVLSHDHIMKDPVYRRRQNRRNQHWETDRKLDERSLMALLERSDGVILRENIAVYHPNWNTLRVRGGMSKNQDWPGQSRKYISLHNWRQLHLDFQVMRASSKFAFCDMDPKSICTNPVPSSITLIILS